MSQPALKSDAEQLTSLLWRLNLVNTEAAELCGVSERTVYRWLAGDTKIPAAVLSLLKMTLSLRQTAAKV